MAAAPLPPSQPVVTSETAPLSQGARIIDTFIAPSKTFTDLKRSAAWWAPWLVISIFSILFIFAIGKQIGFEQVNKNIISRSPKQAELKAKARGLKIPQELIVSHRSGVSLTRSENVRVPVLGRAEIARSFAEALKTFQKGGSQ